MVFKKKFDNKIQTLNKNLLNIIFKYLKINEILKIINVNKQFRQILNFNRQTISLLKIKLLKEGVINDK